MRHRHSGRKLNRTDAHRNAMLQNMAVSLVEHEVIKTTLPKAKELKPQIDKVITIGKSNVLSNKKRLFSKLQDKKSVTKVFINFFCFWVSIDKFNHCHRSVIACSKSCF